MLFDHVGVGRSDLRAYDDAKYASFDGYATDPAIAKKYAGVTFLSDNRADLAKVSTPSLVMQCTDDIIAPHHVGQYVAEHLRDSTLIVMNATGHTAPTSAHQRKPST